MGTKKSPSLLLSWGFQHGPLPGEALKGWGRVAPLTLTAGQPKGIKARWVPVPHPASRHIQHKAAEPGYSSPPILITHKNAQTQEPSGPQGPKAITAPSGCHKQWWWWKISVAVAGRKWPENKIKRWKGWEKEPKESTWSLWLLWPSSFFYRTINRCSQSGNHTFRLIPASRPFCCWCLFKYTQLLLHRALNVPQYAGLLSEQQQRWFVMTSLQ